MKTGALVLLLACSSHMEPSFYCDPRGRCVSVPQEDYLRPVEWASCTRSETGDAIACYMTDAACQKSLFLLPSWWPCRWHHVNDPDLLAR